MTRPTKREQLAAMRLEDFKAHLRTIRWRGFKGRDHQRTAPPSSACAQSQEGSKAEEALSEWHLLINSAAITFRCNPLCLRLGAALRGPNEGEPSSV
jgi:hypothetical protein